MRFLMFDPEQKAISKDEVFQMAADAKAKGKIKGNIPTDPEDVIVVLEEAGIAHFDSRLLNHSPGGSPCGVPR